MTRKELICALVMRAIADDYESIETVSAEVSKWASERRLATSQTEVIAQLNAVVAQGLAKVYGTSQRGHLVEMRSPKASSDSYFHLTDEGTRMLKQMLSEVWIESDWTP